MEKQNVNKKELGKRYFIFFLGMFLYAYGSCLVTKTSLGITAIISVSYVISLILGTSLGRVLFGYNLILIVLERILFGKDFEKKKYLQLPISIVFSFFIDLCMYSIRWVSLPSITMRSIVFVIAIVIMGLGICLTLCGDIVVLPAEGFVQAIVYRTNIEFGKAKVLNDCIMVVLTVIISLIGLGSIEAIQIGTVIAALTLGYITKFFLKRVQPMMDRG